MPASDFGVNARWVGPFRLREYLASSFDAGHVWPPEAAGVYVVSRCTWQSEPTPECEVLYIGGNAKNPLRFRNRVGELVKDMLGFWGDDQGGSHSGGQKLWNWCRDHDVHPLDLWLGWIEGIDCHNCGETSILTRLTPTLNKKRSPLCKIHSLISN